MYHVVLIPPDQANGRTGVFVVVAFLHPSMTAIESFDTYLEAEAAAEDYRTGARQTPPAA